MFANSFGVQVSYGGRVTKASDQLDGIYATVPNFGGLMPSAAIATIFGKRVGMLLIQVLDQVSGQPVNKLMMWDRKKWWTSQQDLAMAFVGSQEINSVLMAYAKDGNVIAPLFQQPSVNFVKTVQSKLFARPHYMIGKVASRVWGLLENDALASLTLAVSIDSETSSSPVTLSAGIVVWTNNSGAPVVWTNAAGRRGVVCSDRHVGDSGAGTDRGGAAGSVDRHDDQHRGRRSGDTLDGDWDRTHAVQGLTMPLPVIFGGMSAALMSDLDQDFAAVGALTIVPCTVTGTNTLALSPSPNSPAITVYTDYLQFSGAAAATNTGATTAAIGALPALPVYKDLGGGPVALVGGEIVANNLFELVDVGAASGSGGFHLNTETAGGRRSSPLTACLAMRGRFRPRGGTSPSAPTSA